MNPQFSAAAFAQSNTNGNASSTASPSNNNTNSNIFAGLQQAISAGGGRVPPEVVALLTRIQLVNQMARVNQQQQQQICAPLPLFSPQSLGAAASQLVAAALQRHQSAFRSPNALQNQQRPLVPMVDAVEQSPALRHDETVISFSDDGENQQPNIVVDDESVAGEVDSNNFTLIDASGRVENMDTASGVSLQSPTTKDLVAAVRADKKPPRKRSRAGGGQSNKTAEVWRYFEQIPQTDKDDGQSARCKLCETQIKTTNSSTTGMLRHLCSCHKKEYVEVQWARLLKHCENESNRILVIRDILKQSGLQLQTEDLDFDTLRNIFESSLLNNETKCFPPLEEDFEFGGGSDQKQPKHSVHSIIGGSGGGDKSRELGVNPLNAQSIEQYLKNFKKNTIKGFSSSSSKAAASEHKRTQKREKGKTGSTSPAHKRQNCNTTSSDLLKASSGGGDNIFDANKHSFTVEHQPIKSEMRLANDQTFSSEFGGFNVSTNLPFEEELAEDTKQHLQKQEHQLQTPILPAKIKKVRKSKQPTCIPPTPPTTTPTTMKTDEFGGIITATSTIRRQQWSAGGETTPLAPQSGFILKAPKMASIPTDSKVIDEAIAWMVLFDKTESLLEKPGFRRFVEFVIPDYQMPDAGNFRSEIFPRVLAKFHQNNPHHRGGGEGLDISGVSPATTVESGFIDDHDGSEQSSLIGSVARKQSFDALIQHSIRSAQNISSEFSYSIELNSPENAEEERKRKELAEDSDNSLSPNTASSSSSAACSENALQSKIEQFLMFIGFSREYQDRKEEYNSMLLNCNGIYEAFEHDNNLRKGLASLLGSSPDENSLPDIDSFCNTKCGQEIPSSTIGKCIVFVDNHYEALCNVQKTNQAANSLQKSLPNIDRKLLSSLREQYESSLERSSL